uniref:Peptidase S1 domain-containing protein n=1 Tax=Hucho hucho TaxID=62062 RepID=A0A4W5RFM5_9TELE
MDVFVCFVVLCMYFGCVLFYSNNGPNVESEPLLRGEETFCSFPDPPVCGRPMVSIEIHQRILGGEVAPKGTFPWQMLLSVEAGRSGGMVIGDRWILTAAHGLVHQHNNQVIKKSEVMAYVGDNNVENLLQSPPLEVSSLHPHPGYNNTDGLSFNHDIALIKLQHPLTKAAKGGIGFGGDQCVCECVCLQGC